MLQIGKGKVKEYVNSYRRTMFIGTPMFLIINYFMCYFNLPNDENLWIFLIVFVLISSLTSFFCLFFPLRAIKRYEKLVDSIEIDDLGIDIRLINGKVIRIEKTKYQIKASFFMFGNSNKKCISILDTGNDKEYFILPYLFDNPSYFKELKPN
ncbi:hypothetical protein [Mucilaginibacter straminoryzae]|nr:hypothetical protein [Mucilaginibacter straminoryzae]